MLRLPWWFPYGRVPEIKPEDLHARLRRGEPWQIVDVRQPLEYRGGHVRGAINLPINQFKRGYRDLRLDPSRPVAVICLTAHRSIPAVRFLRQEGFAAWQLAGGLLAWRAQGLPEEKERDVET